MACSFAGEALPAGNRTGTSSPILESTAALQLAASPAQVASQVIASIAVQYTTLALKSRHLPCIEIFIQPPGPLDPFYETHGNLRPLPVDGRAPSQAAC